MLTTFVSIVTDFKPPTLIWVPGMPQCHLCGQRGSNSNPPYIYIVLLGMKGCICNCVKWEMHPFISKGTNYQHYDFNICQMLCHNGACKTFGIHGTIVGNVCYLRYKCVKHRVKHLVFINALVFYGAILRNIVPFCMVPFWRHRKPLSKTTRWKECYICHPPPSVIVLDC